MREAEMGTSLMNPTETRPVSVDTLKSDSGINLYSIVVATVVFVLIISWYECLRLGIDMIYLRDEKDSPHALSYFIYTVIGTIIAVLIIVYCMRSSR